MPTPRQVALAFLTLRPSIFAIPKASSVDHVEENAGASGVHLSKNELAVIDTAFPRGPRRALPMLKIITLRAPSRLRP
jgi:diketogulonate reductase-like aldo/keto reductase